MEQTFEELKKQFEKALERELSDAIQETNPKRITQLQREIIDLANIISDYEEDFKLKLCEYKSKVIKIVLEKVGTLWQMNVTEKQVTIETSDPITQDMITDIKDTIREMYPELDLDLLMSEPIISRINDTKIMWDWK